MSAETPDVLAYPLPDVLAYPLEEARRVLTAAGFTVEVTETRPPRAGPPAGTARVVRQEQDGRQMRLVVTSERFAPPAPPPER